MDESSRIEGLLGEQRESVDGEAPIGADAVALAVAMDTAKHDPALARKAGNYLDEEQALVKLQIKHFDEERLLAIAAAKRERYLDRLRMVGATMLAAIGVTAVGALIVMVWHSAHDTGAVLDACSTPAPMSTRGLNGAMLANELIGQLCRIHTIVAKHSITHSDEVRKDSDDGVKAIEAFKVAHEKGPHFADPLKGWGDALAAERKSMAAIEKYEEALEADPIGP
ncbi:MAG: hypothetical protein ABSC32_20960 [Steroidobacteraceae bacterium]